MQKIAKQASMQQKLVQYMQIALSLAQNVDPNMANMIGQDIMVTMNGGTPAGLGAGAPNLPESDNISGIDTPEHTRVANARSRASNAAQPAENGPVKTRGR